MLHCPLIIKGVTFGVTLDLYTRSNMCQAFMCCILARRTRTRRVYAGYSVSFLLQHSFDYPVVEDTQPSGAGWLIHSKTLHSYLSLLGSSQLEETQEACCGVLQNLTANEGLVRNTCVAFFLFCFIWFFPSLPGRLLVLFIQFSVLAGV